jgi:hypothetical protein
MLEENKWATNVHAIGSLKISASQASIVEDHNETGAYIEQRRIS